MTTRTAPAARRPLVGLSTYREPAAWGVWNQDADLLPTAYADAVAAAGGVPVLLPPAAPDPPAADAALARLDGLVLTGGADVDPARYGQAPHPRTRSWRPDRDRWETALAAAAERRRLPTLGVCRGMQLLAVAAGGELEQHTPDVVGHDEHGPGGDAFGTTEVRAATGSLVARAEGDRLTVHCHHHQSVRSHPGYAATAWAADGTVEAMETADAARGFCLAVQWHPETSRDQRLFDALVTAAAAYAAEPRRPPDAGGGSLTHSDP